jgi:Holliday junction resolvase
MAINSKTKGNCNERAAAQVLTEWTGHEFVRVPQSGGLGWDNKQDVCGDLISTDKDFDCFLSIETKHYRSLGLKKSIQLLRENSVVYRFMEQCKRDAKTAGKKPFLMLRENGMKSGTWYIFLPVSFSEHLKFINYLPIRYSNRDNTIIGFNSEIFFEKISYKLLKWIYG